MNCTPRDLTTEPDLDSVLVEELQSFNLSQDDATALCQIIVECFRERTVPDRWMALVDRVLTPELPFELHRWLFDCVNIGRDVSNGPPAAWYPSQAEIASANVTGFAKSVGQGDYQSLRSWAEENRAAYWQAVINSLDVDFVTSPSNILQQTSATITDWLPGAEFNVVDSCFQAPTDKIAIITRNENNDTSATTYGELQSLVNRVANGLLDAGFRAGDRIGMMLPMTAESVAAYLGTIKAGCVAVSIAESFAPKEIAIRMQLANAKAIFLTDVIHRAGKQLPCYAKFVETNLDALAIVIPSRPTSAAMDPESSTDSRSAVGDNDVTEKRSRPSVRWNDFLSDTTTFQAIAGSPNTETNILFSSGTTGEPKAIPWTATTPFKCAADAKLHQNVHCASVVAWPTSLGWMMGPWQIYASLMNKATMALFDGAANRPSFCQFVQDAKVTMLGVIPSLVSAWRNGQMIDGMDWSDVEAFSSTGECSNADDMLFLMSRAGYRPVIEYCGGTEIGGGYITGTVVQPSVPGCFSTVALGLDLVLLNDGEVSDRGEVFLVGPSIGLSQSLLNANHHTVYFKDAPQVEGLPQLRRHGDELVEFSSGYYQACGRTDDTMNLGGIKISAVELERCLNQLASVRETAAVAVPENKNGPAGLVVFAVPTADSTADELKTEMQTAISCNVNPLFRIRDVILQTSLPRTASNKIIRRNLRELANK